MSDVREELSWFSYRMESMLAQHDEERGVDGWHQSGMHWLLDRAKGEIVEAEAAVTTLAIVRLDGEDPGKAIECLIDECADVANFAMMVADRARKLSKARANR